MLIYDVLHKEAVYHSVVNDLRSYGVKYRFKKSMFKTERSEGIKQISKKVFKTPLSYQPLDVVNLSSGGIVHVPVFVSQASTFLEKHAAQEGLFRKAGSQLRQKELIIRLDSGGTLGEKHHAIDVANCLKTFFRDLPEPLIPYTYHDLFVHCAMLKAYRVEALLLACILLPPHHLNTLAFFMEFLQKVSLYEKQNKMGTDNLAKVIGPNIMPLQEATMSAVQMRLELHLIIVKILIENAESIGVLPNRITQAISMETIGSTDNELDISDSHLRFKSRKKKHRSGSLTRKPHLSASNLNLRMFNGLKKIVGKSTVSDDGSISDNQRVPENCDPSHASNTKSTKKRKVTERVDPSSTKKKRVIDKSDKSKKLRLSLDRFVPKKPKTVYEDPESYTNTIDAYTERRWSSVSNTCDSQRKYRTHSDGLSELKLILKDGEVSNDLHKEYNNLFTEADVNLSDDSNEQVLSTKEDNISTSKCSSSEELKILDNFSYPSRRRLTLNNFKAYSHVELTSVDNQSEEYVTISKSEYEDIKNRVSAIESRLSQEFGCVDNEESVSLSPPSVKKVQTAYEKTLEEASIESTATTDYLARRLGKELKIRRSGEHKIIRSPSARKIGTLRRRSQERIMSWKKSTTPWKDAEGYFKSTNQTNTPVTQTGRASIAKLRTQNAGMVLAKAKLFDECTTKVYNQNAVLNKKNNWLNKNDNQFTSDLKHYYERNDLCQESSKNIKNGNTKLISKNSQCCITAETEGLLFNQQGNKACYTSQDSDIKTSIPRVISNMHINVVSDIAHQQKENITVKIPPTKQIPVNTILDETKLSVYKPDGSSLCRTPHIKKPLSVKTPKSAKTLVRRPIVDARRTPLKAVGQLGTPKYQSPKGILKTPRSVRH
ncbi:Rho GTPase-activating protein 11A, partial [Dufourea novaeangliae]